MAKAIKVDFDIVDDKPIKTRVDSGDPLTVRGFLRPRSIKWKRGDKKNTDKKDYKITMIWKGKTKDEPDDLIGTIAIADGDSKSQSAAPKRYGRWSYSIRVEHRDDPSATDTLDPTIIFKRGVDKGLLLLWILAGALLILTLILLRQS